jgi:uncharacterized membrane protein YccF (DUF307 family)
MLYILALCCPPLACLGAGRFWHAVLSLALCVTLVGIPVAMIHAWFVVKGAGIQAGPTVIVHNQNVQARQVTAPTH